MKAPTPAKSRRASAAQKSVTRAVLAAGAAGMATEPRAPPAAVSATSPLLGRSPGGAEGEVDLERHAQVGGAVHHLEGERGDLVVLVRRHLEDDLVVDLEHDAALEPPLAQCVVQADERHLEDVGG